MASFETAEILLVVIVYGVTGGILFLIFGARERRMFKMFRRKTTECMPLAWGDMGALGQKCVPIREQLASNARLRLQPAPQTVERIRNWKMTSRGTERSFVDEVLDTADLLLSTVYDYDRHFAASLPRTQSLRGYMLALVSRLSVFNSGAGFKALRYDADTFISNYERARFGSTPWTEDEVILHKKLTRRLVNAINQANAPVTIQPTAPPPHHPTAPRSALPPSQTNSLPDSVQPPDRQLRFSLPAVAVLAPLSPDSHNQPFTASLSFKTDRERFNARKRNARSFYDSKADH